MTFYRVMPFTSSRRLSNGGEIKRVMRIRTRLLVSSSARLTLWGIPCTLLIALLTESSREASICFASSTTLQGRTPASMSIRELPNELPSANNLSHVRDLHYNTLMNASAAVSPLMGVTVARSSSIGPDSSHRPLDAQHRLFVYPPLPPGA